MLNHTINSRNIVFDQTANNENNRNDYQVEIQLGGGTNITTRTNRCFSCPFVSIASPDIHSKSHPEHPMIWSRNSETFRFAHLWISVPIHSSSPNCALSRWFWRPPVKTKRKFNFINTECMKWLSECAAQIPIYIFKCRIVSYATQVSKLQLNCCDLTRWAVGWPFRWMCHHSGWIHIWIRYSGWWIKCWHQSIAHFGLRNSINAREKSFK